MHSSFDVAKATFMRPLRSWRFLCATAAVLTVTVLAACGGGGGSTSATASTALACDDGLKTAFRPDANTQVLLVKKFKAGDSIALANTPVSPTPPTAAADLCLVKLLVGPGNAGPVGALSTSAGIGIEVWLPTSANWNQRIRAYGSGGWAGSYEADITQVGGGGDGNDVHLAAAGKGYVVVTSDHGHADPFGAIGASFAMKPDGTINTTLWKDFAERSLHEMADKSKALAKLFYGKAHKYAYWDGFSTGGRQGLKLAQVYPNDFDGILSGAPAINWTRFITNELYPQIAMLRDLGANISDTKISAVTTASVNACGGATLGFLLDPYSCRYNPTKDASALCSGVSGNGGVTGTNTNASTCVTLAEATAINKIWYGQTTDGSVPDPASDNASGPYLNGFKQLWFGLTRGTDLSGLAGSTSPFPIAADQVALELQDPSMATPFFTNAISNGLNHWNTLDYAGLTAAAYQGLALQSQFSNINTDNPDLTAFSGRNGKILQYHGLNDNLIAPQGSDNYYNRVAAVMGGVTATQSFYKLYHIPGLAHTGHFTGGPSVPLPQPSLGRDEMFQALQNWVENGTAPGRIDVTSSDSTVTMPLCVYPAKATYSGSGSVTATASYNCL